jgi:HEAT repeat protein
VPQLIEVLASQHLSVRRKAPLALGRIGPQAKRAVPALVRLLEDDDSGVRVNAAAALWQIARDPRGIDALEEAIRQGTYTEPYKAAVALGRLGPDAETAVPVLIAALGHADEDVRRASARALGQIGPAAIPAVQQALAAPQEPVRRYAVQALGWIGPPALPALIEALDNNDAPVRASAARELGRLGPEASAARPALVEAVDDPDPKVRAAAARALGRIGPVRDGQPPARDSSVE